jgi:hypothetical protein
MSPCDDFVAGGDGDLSHALLRSPFAQTRPEGRERYIEKKLKKFFF